MIRRLAPVLGSILVALLSITPALASEPQPDILTIQEIAAYQNARETGDQLYIITYEITGNYTRNIDQMFIFRLTEGGIEVDSTAAFPYYNNGYGMGVVAFYFTSGDAPTWDGAIAVQVIGNPLIDWDGPLPSTILDSIDWNTGTVADMRGLIGAKILYIATILGQEWDVEMVATVQGITSLTSAGASYFTVVVPYATEMVPAVFGNYIFGPDYPIDEKPADDTYADDLLDGVAHTVFDLRPAAREWGMSSGALTTTLWFVAFIGLFIMLIQKRKLNRGTILVFWPIVVMGAWFGVPLSVTIIGAFFCLITTVWVFYKAVT